MFHIQRMNYIKNITILNKPSLTLKEISDKNILDKSIKMYLDFYIPLL